MGIIGANSDHRGKGSMGKLILRRLLSAIPLLIGINLITLLLFFAVNSPEAVARAHLGTKHISQEQIEVWLQSHGYNYPLFYNAKDKGVAAWTQTLWWQKAMPLFTFDFGLSDNGRDINQDIKTRMWPSLSLAIPLLFIGIFTNIVFALFLLVFRYTWVDKVGNLVCVVVMSISPLFYIMVGQYLVARTWLWLPVSGYIGGVHAWHFVLLPVMVGVLGGVGMGVRWYRSLLLEEVHQDYVRTARAKGQTEWQVLWRQVLPNALLPIMTGIVVIIPSLFMGSLILESFFGIPGLGNYMLLAIQQQDYAIVRSMVFLGSVLYIIGLILTDIVYALVDPRVRLE